MSRPTSPSKVNLQIRVIMIALIVLAFAAIIVASQGSGNVGGAAAGTSAPASAGDGPSQSHADSMVAYDAALTAGKPIYLLFHSLTCDPCVEISAVVDKVIGDYEGKVVFVNAISTDEPAMRLAEKFQFQYIPHSFFLNSKGGIVDQFEGAMDEAAMREYLDRLIADGQG